MRVTLIEFDSSGGMIHFAYQFCAALSNAETEVTLITGTDYELGFLPHDFSVAPILKLWSKNQNLPSDAAHRSRPWRLAIKMGRASRRAFRALVYLREWVRLVAFIVKDRPDIVQIGQVRYPLLEGPFLKFLRACGIPLVQICHELENRETPSSLFDHWVRRMNNLCYAEFSFIFFLASDTRNEFLARFSYPRDKTDFFPHGNQEIFLHGDVETDEIRARYGFGPDDTVFLFFGSIRPSKGLPDLFRAFALLSHEIGARLLVAGAPTKYVDTQDLHHQVAALGIADRVVLDLRYIPFEEVGPIVTMCTAMVLPYRNATQSGAVQLAYSFARPVVVTSVGGLREVVEHEETGMIVSPSSVDELHAALEYLARDPEGAEEMGRNARGRSQEAHSWADAIERAMTVYQAVRRSSPNPT